MINELLDEFTNEKLCTLARVIMEFRKSANDGVSLQDTILDWGGEAAKAIDKRKRSSLVARPKQKLNQTERKAFESIVERALDPETGIKDAMPAIVMEARRRIVNNDYGGEHRPSWLSRGKVPSEEELNAGVVQRNAEIQAPDVSLEVPVKASGRMSEDLDKRAVQRLEFWAEQLGIAPGSDSQKSLRDLAGDYLIIRYLSSRGQFVVSHMKIDPPLMPGLPTLFRTRGGEGGGKHDFRQVNGAAFVPSGSYSLATVGRIGQEVNIRAAMLTAIDKVEPIDSKLDVGDVKNSDLQGLRISPGSVLRGQVAHRIWCSKIIPGYHDQSLLKNYDTFPPEIFRNDLSKKIDGFEQIVEFVTKVPTMDCNDGFDKQDDDD